MSKRPRFSSQRPIWRHRAVHVLWGTWFISVFVALASTTLCLIAVWPGQSRRRSIARLGARVAFWLAGAWPRTDGLERLPKGASIVVANHASYLDGMLLTAVLPSDFRFVIKREVTKVPLMNFYLQRIGAHFVERFDPNKGARDTRKIMQTAANGESLAFFPEGTFRREPGLRRFQTGAFRVAIRKELPLVPITINGTREMLPAGSFLPKPCGLTIQIARPLNISAASTAQDAMLHCREQVLKHLEEPDLHPQTG